MNKIAIEVDHFDDWGKAVGTHTVQMTPEEISEVIGCATKVIAIHRAVRRSSTDMDEPMRDLEDAVSEAGLLEPVPSSLKP